MLHHYIPGTYTDDGTLIVITGVGLLVYAALVALELLLVSVLPGKDKSAK